jgi:hypothetical protein
MKPTGRTICQPLIALLLFVATSAFGQEENPWQQKPAFTLMGFADVFYVYDFNEPAGNARQPFLFNHNRHNEFNLNLGLVNLQIEHSKYRASMALQSGTYANDNYAAEQGVLKNIFEAYIGISLNDKNNLWLDAGIMPSHLGFESAMSIDNPTLTRSLAAESSPYFLTGAKLTYSPSDTWEMAVLVVNGWQRIQRVEGNSLPSFGTQLVYKPTEKVSLNWSTFIGTDDPDTTRRMRYFSNLYGLFSLSDKWSLITGFDLGAQQQAKGSSEYNLWLAPVVIAQYRIDQRWATAVRLEYYQDESGVIIPTDTPNGFKTTGVSANVDYSPIPNLACRLEARWFSSKDSIFETNTDLTATNFFIGTSIALRFEQLLSKD